MIELMIAATLPWCGVVEDMWPDRVTDCFEVAGQSASAGPDYEGLTVDQPWVYIPSQYDADNPAGAIDVRVGPEPDEGYWMVGAVPACIREQEDGSQEIVRAGTGGLGEMFPGHYWSAPGGQPDPDSLDTGGWLLAFTDDPCLVPHTRAAAVFVGYTEDEPYDVWIQRFELGEYRIEVIGTEPTYASGAGSITIRVHQDYCTGVIPGTCSGTLGSLTRLGKSVNGTNVGGTGTSGAALWHGGSPDTWYAYREFTLTFDSSGLDWLRFDLQYVGSIWYYPPGHPLYEAPGEGYQGQSFLVIDDAFDDFVYSEPSRPWQVMDGVCDSQACLDSYCDGISPLDLGDLVSCWFRWDVEWSEWFEFVGDQINEAPFVAAMRYGITMLGAYPLAVASLDGQCGSLADMSSTPLQGMNLDTCVLPHQSEFRAIAAAFIYIAFAMFIWRSLASFIQGGQPEEPEGVAGKKAGRS